MKVKALVTFHHRSRRIEKGKVWVVDYNEGLKLERAGVVKEVKPKAKKSKEEKFNNDLETK